MDKFAKPHLPFYSPLIMLEAKKKEEIKLCYKKGLTDLSTHSMFIQ